MRKIAAAAVFACLLLAGAGIASASSTPATTSAPAVTSLTLSPSTLSSGRVKLKVTGENAARYDVRVECPERLYLKSGSRAYCDSSHSLTAKRMRRLSLRLRNPSGVEGVIKFFVSAIDADGRESAERPVSLRVTGSKK